jgi:hypothetical protein
MEARVRALYAKRHKSTSGGKGGTRCLIRLKNSAV